MIKNKKGVNYLDLIATIVILGLTVISLSMMNNYYKTTLKEYKTETDSFVFINNFIVDTYEILNWEDLHETTETFIERGKTYKISYEYGIENINGTMVENLTLTFSFPNDNYDTPFFTTTLKRGV